jgi:proline iminopeptidase
MKTPKRIIGILLLFLGVIALCSCANRQIQSDLKSYFTAVDEGIQTGNVKMVNIESPKGEFRVWTKRFGNNPDIKVLLLHGGPGGTHEYFECFENFLPAEGIEFIYYDQLGSAYSDQPNDTSLWNIDRFADEVEQVRKALKLDKTNFYLLGQSWGGMLAVEYAVKYQDNLKALILSNTSANSQSYIKYNNEVLAKQMPPDVLNEIKIIESKGDYDNPKYMELLIPNYYEVHIYSTPMAEWPEPFLRTMNKLNNAPYLHMWGPSEFGVTGNLEKWDRTKDIRNLKVPLLAIGAKNDSYDPDHLKWIANESQNGSYLYCPNGSHMCMFDDQKIYFNGLIKFIKSVNAGKLKVSFED